jgi:hypothetical protein
VHAQVQVDALLGSDERGQNIQNSRNAWKISSVLSNVSEIVFRHKARRARLYINKASQQSSLQQVYGIICPRTGTQ